MEAVVAGAHNAESTQKGGEGEATMAANTMREHRRRVWQGEVAFHAGFKIKISVKRFKIKAKKYIDIYT